jgi:hypothetical protein
MNIPPFSEDAAKELGDIDDLIKRRVVDNTTMCSEQSLRLISYMAWPHSEIVRREWMRVQTLLPSSEHETADRADEEHLGNAEERGDAHWAITARSPDVFLSKLKLIQQHWARTADILHLHYDMAQGRHQKPRGGPSVGKAIHLIAMKAHAKGTGKSKLWQVWRDYKDVSHLVAAAVLIAHVARRRRQAENWDIPLARFQPVQLTDLLPNVVVAVALTFQTYGLEAPVHGREGPLFDLATLWRIPASIGLSPLPPPHRKLRTEDIVTLNERRAGHRGRRSNASKATPVSE